MRLLSDLPKIWPLRSDEFLKLHQARIFIQLPKKLGYFCFISNFLHALHFLGHTQVKTAFRKWFSYFGELRSICPSATLLVLRFRSLEDTEFEKSTDIREIKQLSLSIKLRISKVSNEVEITMTWLIDDLNDLKENFPRTIIYCNYITDASKLYTYITSRLRMFRRHEYVSFRKYNQMQGSD